MDNKITLKQISSRALLLVKRHIKLINDANISAAKKQLFHPPELKMKPIDVYLESIVRLKPFNILSISVKRIEEIRKKRHGEVATIWISIEVECKLGKRSADISVWWFPDSDKLLISGRPTHWILEDIKKNKAVFE